MINAGSTNQSVYFNIVEDTGGTAPGEPKTGLAFGDISAARYVRQGAAPATITPVTLASNSAAHSDGGFVEVDATNMPGLYRFDVPDAAFASGSNLLVIQLVVAGAQNAYAAPLQLQIQDLDVIADGILDRANGVETGWTLRQVLRIMAAESAGQVSGANTTTVTFRNIANTKDRITTTVDADGNRTNQTLDNT